MHLEDHPTTRNTFRLSAKEMHKWTDCTGSHQLSSELSAALAAAACIADVSGKHALVMDLARRLTMKKHFARLFKPTTRELRFKRFPDSDNESATAILDTWADDDGEVVPLHKDVSGYGKTSEKVNSGLTLCGYIFSLQAEVTVEVDTGNYLCWHSGKLFLQKLMGFRGMRNRRQAIITWACGPEDEQDGACDQATLEHLGLVFAREVGYCKPASTEEVSVLCGLLLAAPFKGNSHEFIGDWPEYLRKMLCKCVVGDGEDESDDSTDESGEVEGCTEAESEFGRSQMI